MMDRKTKTNNHYELFENANNQNQNQNILETTTKSKMF